MENQSRKSNWGVRRHGLGLLLNKRSRRQLVWALIGSAAVAGTEIIALATVVPLMTLIGGEIPSLGPLGSAGNIFGTESIQQISIILAAVLFGSFVIKGVVGIAYRWWVAGFLARQQVDTSARVLSYFLRAPYSLHLQRSLGDFTRRLNDAVTQTYSGVIMNGVTVATEALTVIAILIALLVAQPLPALVLLAYFGLTSLTLYGFTHRRSQRAGQTILSAAEEIFSRAVQPLQNVKDVQLRNNSQVFVSRYTESRWKSAMAGRLAGFLTELPKYVLELVFISGIAIMTVLLFATNADSGNSALATIALFAVAGFRLLPTMTRLMASLNNIRANTPGMTMLLEEMVDIEKLNISTQVGPDVPELTLDQELKVIDLSFRYGGGDSPEILRGINFAVPAGTSLGIVGTSGAGKSTLVDTIMGFHAPSSGLVIADGKDTRSNLPAWRDLIGLVPQEVNAIVGTAVENISFLDPDPDMQRVVQAAKAADLADFIENLPNGYLSRIGPGGAGLSGGQRQRLGLARALYRNPRFLVLDEATSALDNESEHRVTTALRDLRGQMTMLVIAHRLSTVKNCDAILFLEDGRVAAWGTFDEVRTQNETFDRLVKLADLNAHDDTLNI